MIGAITSVWTSVIEWVVTALTSVQAVFIAENQLTFLGVLAVISVAIGIAFLVGFSPVDLAASYSNM